MKIATMFKDGLPGCEVGMRLLNQLLSFSLRIIQIS